MTEREQKYQYFVQNLISIFVGTNWRVLSADERTAIEKQARETFDIMEG